MTIGSGLFGKMRAHISHLVKPGGGFQGEFFDLRQDITKTVVPLAAIAVEEYVDVVGLAAPGAAALLDAAASVTTTSSVLAAAMKAAGLAQLALWPRPLSFTTAGTTPADAPATATITGTDKNGAAQTETVNLAQTGTIANGTKYFKTVTKVDYAAGDGTGATVSIGIGAAVLSPATATVASIVTVLGSALIQGDMATHPRALVFTTGGTTPSDAPANVVITGKDIQGKTISETLTLAQTGTTATSANSYASITSLVYPAADGTGATIAITPSAAIGLSRPIKTRAGVTGLIRELGGSAILSNGTIVAPGTAKPYGSYAPAATFDGSTDFAIYYEYDATQDGDA
jgi:hypothetical protein